MIKDQPDLSAAPHEVRRLLEKCLEKNPKDRLRDIGDAWALLEGPANTHANTAAAAPSVSKTPWLVTVLATVAAVVMAVLYLGQTATRSPAEVSRFRVMLPADPTMARGRFVALSPDGRHLATVIGGRLWVRSFDSLEATSLERTDGATYPFWSPDSKFLGFFADGQLKTISREGGPPRELTAPGARVGISRVNPGGRGGTWSIQGTLLFSPGGGRDGLFAVNASGGEVRAVTTVEAAGGDNVHRYPQFLTDGNRFLYLHLTSAARVAGIYVGSLDGMTPKRVLEGVDQAVYAPPLVEGENGHLFFRRGDLLMAQSFDTGLLRTVGAEFPVAEGVGQSLNTGSGAFSASTTGILAHTGSGYRSTELAWFSRTGERLELVTSLAGIAGFSLSRDQRVAAVAAMDTDVSSDIWVQDLSGGSPSKFTFGPSPGWYEPVMSPDGRWVAYATFNLAGQATYEIRRKPTDMSEAAETLLQSDSYMALSDWARDGDYLVYEQSGELLFLPMEGDRTPVPYLVSPAQEGNAQLSPDGCWLAYVSNELGEPQVFVRPIPATGSLWQISTGGAVMPRWRADGRELFYVATDGTLTAVDVAENRDCRKPAASFGYVPTPKPLFDGVPVTTISRFTYQPSADGQRFGMTRAARDADPSITVVLNWQAVIDRVTR